MLGRFWGEVVFIFVGISYFLGIFEDGWVGFWLVFFCFGLLIKEVNIELLWCFCGVFGYDFFVGFLE